MPNQLQIRETKVQQRPDGAFRVDMVVADADDLESSETALSLSITIQVNRRGQPDPIPYFRALQIKALEELVNRLHDRIDEWKPEFERALAER